MILKEIEMDLPYEKNESRVKNIQTTEGVDYDSAIKLDYNLLWKEKRRIFQLSTRCMTAMIERLMPPILTDECWKILIECVKTPNKNMIRNFLGVYVVQVQFDYEEYVLSTDLEKKKFIIDKVVEVTNIISPQKEVELKEILNTCDRIQNLGFVNEWLWGKPKKTKIYMFK